jgi:hypothetical protein
MATVDELIQEARRLRLDRAAVIAALRQVIAHNERYRARPSRQGKQTDYDILLAKTQPALALACLFLEQDGDEGRDDLL